MRIRLLFCLFPALFFLSASAVFAAESFPDVPADHPHFAAIEFLKEKEVVQGYPDKTFRPETLVNRAEAIKMIVSAFKVSQEAEFAQLFKDVPKSEWFFMFVMAGHKAGIINGHPDGTFKPGTTINKAETLKMVIQGGKGTLPDGFKEGIFADLKAPNWYSPYALYANEKNMIFPDAFGYLNPTEPMTRATFAEVVYRMMVVGGSSEKTFPLSTNWPVYKSSVLPFSMKYDSSWKVTAHSDEVVFLKGDQEFYQFSPKRLYPNSASVTVTLDKNAGKLSKDQYFSNLKLAFPGAAYSEFVLGGHKAMEILQSAKRMVDWYIMLPDSSVLVVYTEYGEGVWAYQFPKFIMAMLSTLVYLELPAAEPKPDYSATMSTIFENVLKEGKGKAMIALLGDMIIIETDTIGVGTGPVDYYYSAAANYTLKYERSEDVILDTRPGKTTAF